MCHDDSEDRSNNDSKIFSTGATSHLAWVRDRGGDVITYWDKYGIGEGFRQMRHWWRLYLKAVNHYASTGSLVLRSFILN